MSKSSPLSIVLLAAFAMSSPAQDTPAQPVRAADAAAKRSPPANLVVGVVDLDRVMEQYPKYIRGRAQLREMNQAYDEKMQQQRKRIEELRASVQLLREGTKERAMKQLELESMMTNGNNLAKLYNADLQIEDMRLQIECYEDLEVAIAQLAKDRGVHVVLRLDAESKPSGAESLSANQVERRMLGFERRKVWFAAEELDLTAALIKMTAVPLDASKDAPKAETSPVPPANNGKDGK